MTVKECYDRMNADYKDVIGRIGSEKLVERFMLKYIGDTTAKQLFEAVSEGNIEESFIAAHSLKGVTANLGFSNINAAASELTEQLRSKSEAADMELFEKVKDEHEKTVAILKEYAAGLQ